MTGTINATKRPNPNLQILGYLMTQFTRNGICSDALAKVQDLFPGEASDTIIRTNVKLQSAPAFRKSIFEHSPASHGSQDYDAFADEVLERLDITSSLRLVKEA